ncbi:MAG TPA: DUF3823 domain-containing protein [Draconibacterium sp.]|nr:DUF3823 domain-containing protein [Draconibacterium sp.]
MKILRNIKHIVLGLSILVLWTGCNEDVTDFGFDGAISGVLKDAAGNIVAGDITSNTIVIKALTEGDIVTTDIRVNGDGTYQNTKLYPKPTKIWITGPVTMTGDTLRVDFSENSVVGHDFVVTPFITVKPPVLSGSASANSITVNYEMMPNNGKVPNLREIYCSTNPYPNASTGSGPQYMTVKVSIPDNSGSKTISGLTSKTKYFIRVGARATGSSVLNYSEQIEVTTP